MIALRHPTYDSNALYLPTAGWRSVKVPRNMHVHPVKELDDLRHLRMHVIDAWNSKSREDGVAFERQGSGYRVHVCTPDIIDHLKLTDKRGGARLLYTGDRHAGFAEGNQQAYVMSFLVRADGVSDMSVRKALVNCEMSTMPLSGKERNEARYEARQQQKDVEEVMRHPVISDECTEELLGIEQEIFGVSIQNLQGVLRSAIRISQEGLRNYFDHRSIPALNVRYVAGKPFYSVSPSEDSMVPWTKPVGNLECTAAQWQLNESFHSDHRYMQVRSFDYIREQAESRLEKRYRQRVKRLKLAG